MTRTIFVALTFFLLLAWSTALPQKKKVGTETPYEMYVTKLPAVDKVEILAIEGLNREDIDCTRPNIICSKYPGKILASKTLVDGDAKRLGNLWRKLETGNGAACFSPAYVLRFYRKDKLVLMTDVCFHCCAISLPANGNASICGNEETINNFRTLVTTEVPFPKRDKND